MPKRRASTKFLAAGNAWRSHVKKTMEENKGLSFKQVLKKAKSTYKKPIQVKNTQYSVQVRPGTRKAGKRKTKKPRRTKRRKKKSTGIFGF